MSGFISNQARRAFLLLAAAGGAALVGNGAETLAATLDALQLADYPALRGYAGPRKSVYVTGYLAAANPGGISGLFIRDDNDAVSADNGGTVIVAANGKRWKRAIDGTVSVEWFGATGAGNDTTAVQAALTFAAPRKLWVIGQGKTYRVSTVRPLSGQRVKALYLQSVGPLAGGAVSFQSVVEIDGTIVAKTDMVFDDVKVDGRRDLFPNIDMNGGGRGEDGGMHAWRVAANAGAGVRDITWRNCSGVNAGTAGLAIHGAAPSTNTANYPIKNLYWTGGKLTGNREHGLFADAFDGLVMVDVDCRGNGLDRNTTDALEHGNRGARSGGTLFGAGFDVESYGPNYVGSLWKNLTLRNLDCRECALPSLFYNPIATNVAGYAPHSGVSVAGCQFDKGTAVGADRPANTNYSFHALGNLVGASYPYIDLIMENNSFSGAAPQFNGVKGLSVTGGYINAPGVKAHIYNCLNWNVSANAASVVLDIAPVIVPVFTKTQGSAGAAITAQTLVRTVSKAGGKLLLHVEGTITGGRDLDGDLIFTTESPIVGMLITELYATCSPPIGVAVATCESVAANGGGTIRIDTVNNSTVYFKVVMVLSGAG